MFRPALLLVAHGSRDPRHAATVAALAVRVREALPGVRVAVGHLDFDAPSVPDALARLYGEGVREVVAVPLLLTRAFHAKTDIPAALADAGATLPGMAVHQSEVLGPHTLLLAALERRLRAAGLAPGDAPSTGVVLAAAGSSDPEAIAAIAATAREWRRTTGWCAVRPAFASAVPCTAYDAVQGMRDDGVARVAVAPYMLAPGRLPDRVADGARRAGADVVAPVLGAAPEVTRVVVERYVDACAGSLHGLSLVGSLS